MLPDNIQAGFSGDFGGYEWVPVGSNDFTIPETDIDLTNMTVFFDAVIPNNAKAEIDVHLTQFDVYVNVLGAGTWVSILSSFNDNKKYGIPVPNPYHVSAPHAGTYGAMVHFSGSVTKIRAQGTISVTLADGPDVNAPPTPIYEMAQGGFGGKYGVVRDVYPGTIGDFGGWLQPGLNEISIPEMDVDLNITEYSDCIFDFGVFVPNRKSAEIDLNLIQFDFFMDGEWVDLVSRFGDPRRPGQAVTYPYHISVPSYGYGEVMAFIYGHVTKVRAKGTINIVLSDGPDVFANTGGGGGTGGGNPSNPPWGGGGGSDGGSGPPPNKHGSGAGGSNSVAFVLTLSAGKPKWSRYEFPFSLDAFQQLEDDLYIRSGNTIKRVSEQAVTDIHNGTDIPFGGSVVYQWNDFGQPGVSKMLEGFDIVADGSPSISIGYDQSDQRAYTDPYEVPPDTVPGNIIPLPLTAPSMSVKVDFASGEKWSLMALGLYVHDNRPTS